MGLEELLQYIRSQADRGARIVAAQAVFKVIRARLGSSDSAIDAEAKVSAKFIILTYSDIALIIYGISRFAIRLTYQNWCLWCPQTACSAGL